MSAVPEEAYKVKINKYKNLLKFRHPLLALTSKI